MMKFSLKSIIALLFVGLCNPALAQLKLLKDDASGGRPITSNPYAEFKGSAYLLDFEVGSILFSEKDTAKNMIIAFNAYDNTLEQKMDGNLLAFIPSKISGFILNTGSKPREFRSGYSIPKIGSNVFVEILVDGEYTLISHHFKTLGDDVNAAYGSQKSKAFQNVEQLYVVKDGNALMLKTKPKFLQETFGSDTPKVNKLIKDYSLDIKERSDVIRLVRLLNT
ncbi:hypothetical protein M3O96_18710 [Aquiflexum sp. TKW24L]|uniref:hypothetical protein n=1 Tax=Aquiflexum sp. TKW24L TaxID=2942212 RepID=UPI0020BE1BED|nr:hypothetical protein [Aquiflexum sp. TKW24L]MCL6261141.1 hypothetical protein [Aquiflexum sp. TKW24L]